MSMLFTAGAGLALLGAASAVSYVEYASYQFGGCETVTSVSVYTGVPTIEGVQTADTCFDSMESTTTSIVEGGLTDGAGILSVSHICNTTEPGQLTSTWYSTDDCDEAAVAYEDRVSTCEATCTDVEPDFGSDEFDGATVSFFDSADCSNATATEEYTVAELYDLFEVEDGSCSASGDFDLYTVIHCSDGSPASVYYEDDGCAGDIVGMTYNPGCVAVPANGTYPGDYFMAECTEEAVVEESSDEDSEEDVDDASGAASLLRLGFASRSLLSSGVVVAASVGAAAAAFL